MDQIVDAEKAREDRYVEESWPNQFQGLQIDCQGQSVVDPVGRKGLNTGGECIYTIVKAIQWRKIQVWFVKNHIEMYFKKCMYKEG